MFIKPGEEINMLIENKIRLFGDSKNNSKSKSDDEYKKIFTDVDIQEIKIALSPIADSNGRIRNKDEAVKFLLYLRKEHHIFKGKHEKTTFEKWVNEHDGNIPVILKTNISSAIKGKL